MKLTTKQIADKYRVSPHVIGMILCKCVVLRVPGIKAIGQGIWDISPEFRVPLQTSINGKE